MGFTFPPTIHISISTTITIAIRDTCTLTGIVQKKCGTAVAACTQYSALATFLILIELARGAAFFITVQYARGTFFRFAAFYSPYDIVVYCKRFGTQSRFDADRFIITCHIASCTAFVISTNPAVIIAGVLLPVAV